MFEGWTAQWCNRKTSKRGAVLYHLSGMQIVRHGHHYACRRECATCRFLSSLIFSILIFLRPTAQPTAHVLRIWYNERIHTLSRIWPQREGKTPHLLYAPRQLPAVPEGVYFRSAPLAC